MAYPWNITLPMKKKSHHHSKIAFLKDSILRGKPWLAAHCFQLLQEGMFAGLFHSVSELFSIRILGSLV